MKRRHNQTRKRRTRMQLGVNYCATHDTYSVSVDGVIAGEPDGSGALITPDRCCGGWEVVQAWDISEFLADEAIEQFAAAKEEALANAP